MARTRQAAVAALLACVLVPAAGAHAAWQAVKPPPAGPGLFVQGLAVSGGTWVVLAPGNPIAVWATRDGGGSWQQVALNAPDSPSPWTYGTSVGPDGAFYLPVGYSFDTPGLLRMARDGNSFDPVPLQLPQSENGRTAVALPAWDAQKRMWLAVSIGGGTSAEVDRIAPDGSVAERLVVPGARGEARALEFVGGHMYAQFDHVFRREGDTMRSIGDTDWPLLQVGTTVLSASGLSLDGGAFFVRRFTLVDRVVGSNRLLHARGFGFTPADGGRFLRRAGSYFTPTGLVAPANPSAYWQTTRGLLVATTDGGKPLVLWRGRIPKLRGSGRLSRVGRSMVARANFYRRQAHLPPVVGDARISRASRNHAAYWARRGTSFRNLLLNAHSEVPRTKGFTGQTPSERCAHVGAECGGEVLNFGNQARSPVDSWVAAPYHRAPFIDPGTTIVGAARVGSVAVMNFSNAVQGVALAPVRFPLGRYRGPLVFPGNEAPDPLAACRAAHQPLGAHPSTPVSFVPPVPADGAITVRLYRGRARVPGCSKVGFFMGRAPLRPGTRYTAKASWRAIAGGPVLTTTWTFKT